jgi:ectoine hydroxylase-related dioxygenase (phytanoyl-CoA dioxygenase family)
LNWLESVQEQGFAIIPEVVTQEDLAGLVEAFGQANLARSKAGVRHAMRLAAVNLLARDSRLLGIASAILGREAFPFRATLFHKSRQSNWLVAWHQDTALPLRERREATGWGPWSVKAGVNYAHAPEGALSQLLALRVHIDDSTANNGPLRVLPGTHTLGVLTDEEIHQQSMRKSAVDCLVFRSGVLAMRPLIVHASSKSQGENPRRVLHVEYATSPVIADGFELAIA